MKITFIILVFFFITAFGHSQNLIPNGDFELGPDSISYGWNWWSDTICGSGDTVYGPDFWIVTNLTPDRQVETDPYFPTSCRDTTFAQSGNAYIIVGADAVGQDEAGKTTLISPLEKDSAYRLSYFISMQTAGSGSVIPVIVEFRFSTGGNNILSPTVTTTSWQFVDTIFTALANSDEIEILASSVASGGPMLANIDNIMLVKESSTGFSNFHQRNKQIKIYPNPSDGVFYIDSYESAEVIIYNAVGTQIIRNAFANTIHCFDFSQLQKGIYFIQIKTKQQTVTQKLLLTN